MNLTTQTHVPIIMPHRCQSCGKKTTWAVGTLNICAACIMAQCERPAAKTPIRTKSGHPVRIYNTDGAGEYSTHGAYCGPNGWVLTSWNAFGDCWTGLAAHSLMIG